MYWNVIIECKLTLLMVLGIVDTADGTWNSLTAAEQAQLYHKYTRIVTPHGAHLANMIYCRNNTRVVEIVLARVEPASNVTMMGGDDPSKPLSDWYGPP